MRLSNLVVEIYQNNLATQARGAIDHFAIAVSDIDAVFHEISASGYKLLNDSVRTLPFWQKGVRFFSIEGPNAEVIEFSQKL